MKKFKLQDNQIKSEFNIEFPDRSKVNFQDDRDRERYYRGEDQMREAQEAIKTLVNRVNSMGNNKLVALAFCREMTRTHRTLQQSLVSQLLIGIQAYAEWAKENNLYDDRNRGFIQMAEDLEKLLEEHGLPFI